jgi:hypothetical protein
MGIVVRNNPQITINLVDLSDHGKQVTINDGQETQDASAFGGSYRVYRAGLGTPSIECVFFNDHVNGSVESTLRDLISVNETAINVVVKSFSTGLLGTSNPVYTLVGGIDGDLSVLDDTHGELSEITVRFVPFTSFSVSTTTS